MQLYHCCFRQVSSSNVRPVRDQYRVKSTAGQLVSGQPVIQPEANVDMAS